MRNRLTEMFGIEFPIFAFSHCRDVVAAVTNAGGMGVLGALAFTPEQLELELKWIDEHVDGKPYGVDVVMPVQTKDRELGLGGDVPPAGDDHVGGEPGQRRRHGQHQGQLGADLGLAQPADEPGPGERWCAGQGTCHGVESRVALHVAPIVARASPRCPARGFFCAACCD